MNQITSVIKSAKRVLEIFEYFAEQRRPLTVSDIVLGLKYPQSSASVLMRSLTKLGYLDYNRYQRLYMPTLRVAMFGGWIHEEMFSRVSLYKLIDDLHNRSGATVVLAMQNEIYLQYIYVVQPSNEVPWYIRSGSLRPIAKAAAGLILLSKKPDMEVLAMLRRINAEETPDHRVNPTDLIKRLDQVRQKGFAFTAGAVNPHAAVVAMELPTPVSQPPMAIGIGGSIEATNENRDRYLALLSEAIAPYRLAFGQLRPLPIDIRSRQTRSRNGTTRVPKQ
jgi:DNA-binding IclR family transcriptional regulator